MPSDAWEDRIVIDPAVLAGKPTIRGTRIAVEFIVDLLAEGWSQEEILANYPRLSRDDILAALKWARELLRAEDAYPVTSRPA
jgi:uncharacterized protein (DUF433 family)